MTEERGERRGERQRVRSVLASLVSFVLIGLALTGATPVCAQVGLVESEDGASIARRLAAELRARGYAVRTVAPELAVIDGTDVEALVWTSDAPPALRLCALTRGHVLRCEELRDGDASVLVLQAMEVLRAHLGEPGVEPEPVVAAAPPEVEAPTCPEPPPPVPRRRVVELGAGLAVLPPTSSLAAGLGVEVLATWSPDPFVALELGGVVSLVDPVLAVGLGSSSFSTRLVWLGADVRVPESLLSGHHLLVGLAVALAGAETHPGAAAPLDERPASLTAFMPMARAAFVAHLDERVRLHAGVRVGAALPQPVLFFADVEVARWGAPLWVVEVALAAALD